MGGGPAEGPWCGSDEMGVGFHGAPSGAWAPGGGGVPGAAGVGLRLGSASWPVHASSAAVRSAGEYREDQGVLGGVAR